MQQAGTPEVKGKALEDNFDWMMMDDKYKDRLNDQYGSGMVFLPRWWGPWGYGHSYGSGQATSAPTPEAPPSGPGMQMPKLPGADFANKVTSGLESSAAGLVGNVESFTGKVTNVTNPVPVSSSRGYSGGGSSCACACACAGCACACAGGGR